MVDTLEKYGLTSNYISPHGTSCIDDNSEWIISGGNTVIGILDHKNKKVRPTHGFWEPDNEKNGRLHKVASEIGYTYSSHHNVTELYIRKLVRESISAIKKDKDWKWLEKLLEKAVEDRHEMLDESVNSGKNLLVESPNFNNLYQAKKRFKEGLMNFDNWIFIDGEQFQLIGDPVDLVSALNFGSEVSIDYLSKEDHHKKVSFVFRPHRNTLIPSDVRQFEN